MTALRDEEQIVVDFDPAHVAMAIATPGALDDEEALVCAALLMDAIPPGDREGLTAVSL